VSLFSLSPLSSLALGICQLGFHSTVQGCKRCGHAHLLCLACMAVQRVCFLPAGTVLVDNPHIDNNRKTQVCCRWCHIPHGCSVLAGAVLQARSSECTARMLCSHQPAWYDAAQSALVCNAPARPPLLRRGVATTRYPKSSASWSAAGHTPETPPWASVSSASPLGAASLLALPPPPASLAADLPSLAAAAELFFFLPSFGPGFFCTSWWCWLVEGGL